MIQMILNMPDEMYNKMRDGVNIGIFKVSFKDIENLGINIVDVRYITDVKND